ncbi:MAG TPA: PAS domain-containing protein, partial [Spirochaetota bacterium]|nr:PAS domain-containing protein [Spirochaetota bacterium]
MTDMILESISDGVFTVNADWIITSFNKAAERITGIRKVHAI